jgi:hypothetical protein
LRRKNSPDKLFNSRAYQTASSRPFGAETSDICKVSFFDSERFNVAMRLVSDSVRPQSVKLLAPGSQMLWRFSLSLR